MVCLNLSDIDIISVKGVDYRCIIHEVSKSEAAHLFENSICDDCEYIQNSYQIK